MNKKEYLKILDELNLDKEKYCIIASGSLLMHDLCDKCNDIDLRVTRDLFNNLLKKYHMKQSDRQSISKNFKLSDKVLKQIIVNM